MPNLRRLYASPVGAAGRLQISEFGLVEITRQRTKPSLERLLCSTCPTCGGTGTVRSPETVYFEVLREVRRTVNGGQNR